MAEYSPKTQEQALAYNHLFRVRNHTGGQIKTVRGFPALSWFSPSHKYLLFYYVKDRQYVLHSYDRTAQALHKQILRAKTREAVWHWFDQQFC